MNASRPDIFTKRAWKPGVFIRCHFSPPTKWFPRLFHHGPLVLLWCLWAAGHHLSGGNRKTWVPCIVDIASWRCPLWVWWRSSGRNVFGGECLGAENGRNVKVMEFLDMIFWKKFGPVNGVVFEPLPTIGGLAMTSRNLQLNWWHRKLYIRIVRCRCWVRSVVGNFTTANTSVSILASKF